MQLVALLLGACLCCALGAKTHLQFSDGFFGGQMAEFLSNREEAQKKEGENAVDAQVFEYEQDDEPSLKDPCQELKCAAGRECIIREDGEGLCQCLQECRQVQDERRKVCSNFNDTWSSDCELYRTRCLCSEGSHKCPNERFEHLHINYYGSCQIISECEKEEMADFPRRMREWLFNIMRDMAYRRELSEHYSKMERVAEKDDARKWSIAAVWKWCEMDGYPRDRSVSRHELFPLRAPLYTLEHCIAPFLDSCDPDDDHLITLSEWIKCLELTEKETEDVENLCEDIQDQ